MSRSMKNDYIKHNRKILKSLQEEKKLERKIKNLNKEIEKLNSDKTKIKNQIKTNNICSICLVYIKNNDDIAKLNCNHHYHLKCILNVTIVTKQYNKCPNCRNTFSTPDNMDTYRRQVRMSRELENENNLLRSRNNLYNRRIGGNRNESNLSINVLEI